MDWGMKRPSRPEWLEDPDERQRLADIQADVDSCGWSGLSVGAREECPAFEYTVGLVRLGHPELIVFGLSSKTRHGLLHHCIRCIHAGRPFLHGERRTDVVPGSEFQVRRVHERHFADHVGYAMWYHRFADMPGELEVMQIVWPDESGRFPSEPGFDPRFALEQPDLSV